MERRIFQGVAVVSGPIDHQIGGWCPSKPFCRWRWRGSSNRLLVEAAQNHPGAFSVSLVGGSCFESQDKDYEKSLGCRWRGAVGCWDIACWTTSAQIA